jgi:2-dehydropantoate 2-reductase
VNILIIGAGAIGSLVGGKLALAGETVTFAGRPGFAEVVQRRGLQLEDETGIHKIENLRAADNIADAFAHAVPFDIAVMTVKSYDTLAAMEECAAAAAAYDRALPIFLSLQNGVGNEAMIAQTVGEDRVIAGTITTPVSSPAPATIRVDRPRYGLGLGDPAYAALSGYSDELADALGRAGFTVTRYADAEGMKWTKLLMNMVGNATGAILGASPEEVFAHDAIVDLEIEAWREALRVMDQADIAPQNVGSYPFRVLAPAIRYAPKPLLRAGLRKQIGGARGGKMPSLYLDLTSGKGKSEVPWLNGAVVDLGRIVGVATPVNGCLTDTLLALVADPASRAMWEKNYTRLAAYATP